MIGKEFDSVVCPFKKHDNKIKFKGDELWKKRHAVDQINKTTNM